MRARRWWILFGLVVGLLLAGSLLASWSLLQWYGPTFARERIEAVLADLAGQPVRIERVDLRPWLGRVVVRGLVVGPEGAGAEPLLRLGRLEIRLGLRSLWQGELVISRVRLEDLALALVDHGGAGGGLATLALPERIPAGPLQVRLLRVELLRGGVRYHDPAASLTLELAGLEGNLRPEAQGTGVTLRAERVALRHPAVTAVVEGLRAEGDLEGDQVRIRSLTTRWLGQEVALSGSLRPLAATPSLALTLRATVDLAPLAGKLAAPLPVTGRAAVALDLAGAMTDPTVAGRVSVPALAVGPLQAQRVSLVGGWAGGRLTLERIQANLFGGELTGSARLDPARPEAGRITFALQNAGLPALDGLLPQPTGLRGRVSLRGELAGDPTTPEHLAGSIRVEAAALLLPPPLARLGAGVLRAELERAGDAVRIRSAEGRWPHLEVTAQGELGREGPRGLAVALRADLGGVGALWGFRQGEGTVRLAGTLRGPWALPEVAAGRLQAGDLGLYGVRLLGLDAPFRLAPGSLEATATARVGRTRVQAGGGLAWSGDPARLPPAEGLRFRLEARAPEAHWEDLAAWIPPGLQGSGRLAVTGSAAGTLARWRGTGTLRAAALAGPQGIPLRELSASLTLDPERLEVERLEVRLHDIPVAGRGAWRWDGSGQASAEIGPLQLARLPFEAAGSWLTGTGRASLQARIGPGAVEASGTAELQDLTVRRIPLGAGRIEATLQQDTLRLRAALDALRLTGTAVGRLDATDPFTVRLGADGTDLGPIVKALVPPDTIPLEGTLTAAAELAVPREAPGRLRGALTAQTLRLTVADETWENRGPIRLRWEAGRLAVERLVLGSRLGEADATGRLEPGGALDLTVRGQFPLALLPSFTPAVREAAGSLAIQLQVGGTTGAPTVAGSGDIRGGRFRLRDYPDPLREVAAAFTVTPQALRLTEATGILGRSRVRASGDLLLDGWQPGAYRLALAGREVPLAAAEGLQTLWDLDLELVGSGASAQLRGEGRLLRGTYTGDFSLLGLLWSRPSAGPAAPTLALPLQLRLRLDDRLAVRSNLARLQLGGTLTVEGTTADPVLFGTVEVQSGWIAFRNRRFVVQQATARFTDPRRVDPYLRLVSRTRIGEYDVTLAVSGTAQELTVRLTSAPPLTQEQIVALITTGTSELAAGQAAQGILADELGRLLVQDILGFADDGGGWGKLQAGVVEEGGSRRLQVGTELSQDVRVIYWQTLSGGSRRLLRVEYQLLGPLLVAGEQDFQGGYGGDLILRLRLR